jgi:hypothetical protein
MAGRQLAQDLVDETAATRRSPDGAAAGKPLARGSGHGGTITALSGRSVMTITFPGHFLGMMRRWPTPRVRAATT